MADRRWRVALFSDIADVVTMLSTSLRRMGDEPVAAFSSRGGPRSPGQRTVSDATCPSDLDLFLLADRDRLAPVLRTVRPDALICWAFAWRIPPEVLEIPRFGTVNYHPSLLPRRRGPNPLAWTIRTGDSHFGVTWHRLVQEFDAGPIMAQQATPVRDEDTLGDVVPRLNVMALRMLPEVMGMLASGHSGVPQDEDRASQAPGLVRTTSPLTGRIPPHRFTPRYAPGVFSLPPGLARVRRLTSTAGGGASLGRA